jgi:hypothetical protein
MCPACIATATWLVAGATSASGIGALALVKRLRPGSGAEDFQLRMQPEGEEDGTTEDRVAG